MDTIDLYIDSFTARLILLIFLPRNYVLTDSPLHNSHHYIIFISNINTKKIHKK